MGKKEWCGGVVKCLGMKMMWRLGLYSRWRGGDASSRAKAGAARGGDACGCTQSTLR